MFFNLYFFPSNSPLRTVAWGVDACCFGNKTSFSFALDVASLIKIVAWFVFDWAISLMIILSWTVVQANAQSLSLTTINSLSSSYVLVGQSNLHPITHHLNYHLDQSPNLFSILKSPTLDHSKISIHPWLDHTKTLSWSNHNFATINLDSQLLVKMHSIKMLKISFTLL